MGTCLEMLPTPRSAIFDLLKIVLLRPCSHGGQNRACFHAFPTYGSSSQVVEKIMNHEKERKLKLWQNSCAHTRCRLENFPPNNSASLRRRRNKTRRSKVIAASPTWRKVKRSA